MSKMNRIISEISEYSRNETVSRAHYKKYFKIIVLSISYLFFFYVHCTFRSNDKWFIIFFRWDREAITLKWNIIFPSAYRVQDRIFIWPRAQRISHRISAFVLRCASSLFEVYSKYHTVVVTHIRARRFWTIY